jgi:hypothetical protein
MGPRRLFQGFLVLFGVIVIGVSLAQLSVAPWAIIGGSNVDATSKEKTGYTRDCSFATASRCPGVSAMSSAGKPTSMSSPLHSWSTVLAKSFQAAES